MTFSGPAEVPHVQNSMCTHNICTQTRAVRARASVSASALTGFTPASSGDGEAPRRCSGVGSVHWRQAESRPPTLGPFSTSKRGYVGLLVHPSHVLASLLP